MKKIVSLILVLGFCQLSFLQTLNAQTVKIIGNNALYGGLTGIALGTANMLIKDESSFSNLEVWAGVGILGGAGIAVYDLTTATPGQDLLINGFFNSSNNSSFIILLDTVYGAGVGAVIGTASSLIGGNSLTDGVLNGAGYGAWIGFGFGLFDSLLLAGRTTDVSAGRLFNSESLLTLNHHNLKLNLIQPDLFYYPDLGNSTLSLEIEPVLNVFSLKKSF
ncbi:MAG: hypothetical protein EA359_15870 [Balneolaceae bacterium]|nr:MAG: hypothetical protein EA359_15870 [Balneolaceae bacterium]